MQNPVQTQPFTLPKLPYSLDGLAPFISAETLEFHHGRHHQAYIDNLNRLIEGTPLARLSLKEILLKSEGSIFNNAAQAWNHDFYWHSLCPPDKSGSMSPSFMKQVRQDFGSLESLKTTIRECALSKFGSGWTWLVKNRTGHLQVLNTADAGNPLRLGRTPILVCDVWEHAYYIDYRNERAKYLDGFLKLINFEFASHCFLEAFNPAEETLMSLKLVGTEPKEMIHP